MNDILTIISNARNTIHTMEELANKNNDSQMKSLIHALVSDIKNINGSCSRLLEENAAQKNEIKQLKAQIAGEHGFDVKNNVYYAPDGDGPFCPVCYEKRGKKMRLRRINPGEKSTALHACRLCENEFEE